MKLKGSYWLRSGAYTFLERFSLQLFRFGSFYLLVRGLTREHFGIWTLFLIISALVEVARMGLIQNALVKYLSTADDPKVQGRINTASLALNVLLTLGSILVIFIFAQIQVWIWEVKLLDELLYIYIFTTLVLIPFHQVNFIQQAQLQFKGIFLSNVVRHGLFFAYVLYCFFAPNYPFKLLHLAAFQTVAAAAGALTSLYLGRKYLRFSERLDLQWLRWLFSYGKYVVGTNLGSMLIKSLDQLMLGSLVSPVATAVYSTAIKITNLIEVPTQSVAAIVFPQSTRMVQAEGKASVKQLYEKSVGVILALVIPGIVFVMLFPDWVILIVAGPRYLDAVPVLQVSMLFGLFVPFARQFGTMIDAIGKPGLNFFLVIVSAVLNAIFNYFFIVYFESQYGMGELGAAFATLLTFVLLFFANQVILYREIQVSTLQAFLYAGQVYKNGFVHLRNRLRRGAKSKQSISE